MEFFFFLGQRIAIFNQYAPHHLFFNKMAFLFEHKSSILQPLKYQAIDDFYKTPIDIAGYHLNERWQLFFFCAQFFIRFLNESKRYY